MGWAMARRSSTYIHDAAGWMDDLEARTTTYFQLSSFVRFTLESNAAVDARGRFCKLTGVLLVLREKRLPCQAIRANDVGAETCFPIDGARRRKTGQVGDEIISASSHEQLLPD